jgi:hypothetical protein
MVLPDKYIISGTPEQIAVQLPLLQAMYLMIKDAESSSTVVNRQIINPEFNDYLQLTIIWHGLRSGTNKVHQVDKSMRLKHVDPKNITLEQLQTFARNVVNKLNGIVYKTGYCKVKYANYKDGFRTWGYFDTKESGYKIIESMGDLVNKPINKKLLRHEYIFDDSDLKDTIPERVTLFNHTVKTPLKCPVATMRFYRAMMTFPWIGHVEKLCDNKGYIIPSLDFLNAYE